MSGLVPRLCSRCIRNWKPSSTPLRISRLATQIPQRTISIQARCSQRTTQQFQPLVPPTPESLGKAAPAKEYRRLRRWGRRLFYISAAAGAFYLIDKQFYASSINRSLRSFWLGIIVAADYKLNFRPKPLFGGDITDLHRRNAERLFNHLHSSGGLYLKVVLVYLRSDTC